MLCPTCPKKALCKSPCAALERELARMDKPLREVLFPERKLKAISDAIIAKDFFRREWDAQKEYENRESEEQKQKLVLALNLSLGELTPKQRECVQLRFWDDLSPEEIAKILGISRQGVLHHLDAAKKIIKKCLTDSLKTGCTSAHIELRGLCSTEPAPF